MFFNSNRQWILVGLTSTGAECASPLFPGVYTRIGAFNQWITLNTGLSAPVNISTTTLSTSSDAYHRKILLSNIFMLLLLIFISIFII